jgi:hypothetical protein
MRNAACRAARIVVVLATAAAVSGCGQRSVSLYEQVTGSPSYARVTQAETRTREVRDGLDTRFILSATWLSDAWVRAFTEEYSNIYYLDAARRERTISEWRGASEKYVRFFIALYVPDEKGNDLERPDSIWSLRLVRSDEKDFRPVYIRVTSMRPEEISCFFPYSRTWYRDYEVAFPKEAERAESPPRAGEPRLKLVLAGVLGRAVLSWE